MWGALSTVAGTPKKKRLSDKEAQLNSRNFYTHAEQGRQLSLGQTHLDTEEKGG